MSPSQDPETPAGARQFEMELEIQAPRDAVWQAIADDAELRRWFPPHAEIDPRVGGRVRWRWSAAHDWVHRIEICEPGKRLRTRYDSAVDDGAGGKRPLFVDFLLEGSGGTTTLRLVHAGFGPEADFDAEYDGISGGWPHELRSLRLYLERHRGQDRHVVWSLVEGVEDLDDAWKRLTGPEGLACGAEVDTLTEGRPYRFVTAQGDLFEGTVLGSHRHEFCGMDRAHGDAFLRVTVEPACGVWLWLGTYGQEPAKTEALQANWDALALKLFQRESTASLAEQA